MTGVLLEAGTSSISWVRAAHIFSFFVVFFALFVFVLCLVYLMLPVSLDCPFLIASSGFSNVYLQLKLNF